MEKHIKTLGFLYIVYGAMGLFAGLVVFMVFAGGALAGGIASHDGDLILFSTVIGTIVFVIVMISSVPNLIVGYGLIKRKEWARIGAIILGALNLFGFPLGTALGIYTFVVLLDSDTSQAFRKGEVVY